MKHLDNIAQEFGKNIEAIKIAKGMKGKIINRISYLEKILSEHEKI